MILRLKLVSELLMKSIVQELWKTIHKKYKKYLETGLSNTTVSIPEYKTLQLLSEIPCHFKCNIFWKMLTVSKLDSTSCSSVELWASWVSGAGSSSSLTLASHSWSQKDRWLRRKKENKQLTNWQIKTVSSQLADLNPTFAGEDYSTVLSEKSFVNEQLQWLCRVIEFTWTDFI